MIMEGLAKKCVIGLLTVGMLLTAGPDFGWFGNSCGKVKAASGEEGFVLANNLSSGYGILDDRIRIEKAERTYEIDGKASDMIEFDVYLKDCPEFVRFYADIYTTGDLVIHYGTNSYDQILMPADFPEAGWRHTADGNGKGNNLSVGIMYKIFEDRSISVTEEKRILTVAIKKPGEGESGQICIGNLRLYTGDGAYFDTKGRVWQFGGEESAPYIGYGCEDFGKELVCYYLKNMNNVSVKSITGRISVKDSSDQEIKELDSGMFSKICDGGKLTYQRDTGVFQLRFENEKVLSGDECLFGASLHGTNFTVTVSDVVLEMSDDTTVNKPDVSTEFRALSRGRGTGSVSIADWECGGEASKPVLSSMTNGTEGAKVYYKPKSEDDSAYTEKVPGKPGEYNIKAVFPKTLFYEEIVATNTFQITGTCSHENVAYVYDRTGEKEPTCTEKGLGHSVCTVCDEVVEENVETDALGHEWDLKYTIDKEATLIAEGSKSRHCLRCDEKTDITPIPRLDKEPGSGWVMIENWTYKEPRKQPRYGSDTNDVGQAMVEYKREDEAEFSVAYPVNAGRYTIRVTFPGNEDYGTAVAEQDFEIYKAQRPDIILNDVRNVEYSCGTVEDVSLPSDWIWSEKDSGKTLEVGVPLVATAVYNGTDKDNYEDTTVFVTITRQPQTVLPGKGTVHLTGWTYGEKANNPFAESATNGTDYVIYYYKKQGEADANYTTTKPVNAGSYVVKAVFPATVDYTEAVAETQFTIAKAPVAPNAPQQTQVVDYSIDEVSKVALPDNWVWQGKDGSQSLAVGTPYKATAQYNGDDRGNYETETVEVTITRKDKDKPDEPDNPDKPDEPDNPDNPEQPIKGYTVTIVNGLHVTIHAATGEPIQRNVKGAMEPVLFIANAEYYFPENYYVKPVNGIKVRRVSDTRIQVYGTPTANTTIYLAPASRVDTKPHKVTVVNGTGSGSYGSGTSVNIKAAQAPAGKTFSRWRVTQGNVTLVNEKNAATSFTMKTGDVTVVAEYENAAPGSNNGNSQNKEEKTISKEAKKANSREMNKGMKATISGSRLKVDWNPVNGAAGYDIYAGKYNSKKLKLTATLKDGKAASTKLAKVAGKKLDKKSVYQIKVKAYRYVNGKKQYISESLPVFTAGKSNKKYTDAKSIKPAKKTYKLKKKEKVTIKGKLTKKSSKKRLLPEKYVKQLRYFSTNEKIASVDTKGKVTAKKKGSCYIYIVAGNGVKTKVKILVK